MRRILLMLSVATLIVVQMVAPVYGAPKKEEPENFGGNENSTLHRNDNSGKGNFGQCHRASGNVEGQQSSQLNPSSQSPGEADCRKAGDLEASSTIPSCQEVGEGLEPEAESQLTFGTDPRASAKADCV